MDVLQTSLPKIDTITIREIQLPLVHPFQTSFGIEDIKHCILVEVTDSDGNTGWGETTVMNVPSYCYETVDTAWSIQSKFLIPTLNEQNKDDFTLGDLHEAWAPVRGHEFAKGGIEAALLALMAESQEKNLGEIYGASKEKIPTGVSIGIQKDISTLLDRISSFLEQGYQRIKIKIQPGWDLDVVAAIRDQFGTIDLMVDANSAYSLDDTPMFEEMDQYELMMIEQPLAYNDILMHKQLQERLSTPICLDESIHNPRDARLSIEHGCCEIINIKPGRVGGYSRAIEIAKDLGQGKVWCGGMLETGIGRLHNVYLQARSEFIIPGDTSGSNRYYSPDIIEPEVKVDSDGYITVPDGVGLGFTVDTDRINNNTHQAISFKL